MTCNTDEHNDPYRIDINIENDAEGTRKQFFEKGLSALLADPFFLLLYVPANGGRMQVIRPASDLYHRKRMIKRINASKRIPSFYYVLSHLWGLTKENRCLWNEIDDYMDDEEGQPMKPVSMRPEKRDTLLAMLRDHPDSYWWIDVLCARTDTPLDIMGDVYACCLECIVMIDCDPTLIPKIHTASDALEEVEEFMQRTGPQNLTYQQIYQTQASQLSEHLYIFLQCEWWQRVWTWQEMALPVGEVRFMAETDIHRLQINTITLKQLLEFRVMPQSLRDGLRIAYEVCRSLHDIYAAKESKFQRTKSRSMGMIFVIVSLKPSKRRCCDPCDYVYGVLGMMQIKIPRMEDPNAVWRHLLSELDDSYPLDDGKSWMGVADEIDLRQVGNIGEVYKKLYDFSMA